MNEDAIYIKEFLENRSEQAAYNLVQKYRKFVYLTVLHRINDSDEAKDVTQEVFIKALNSLHKFDFRSSFKTWLYRIAANESINMLRKKKIRQFFSISGNDDDENEMQFKDDSPNPEQNYESNELYNQIMAAINKLPKKQREVFLLKYFEQLTYEEISQMMGVSVGALKANYFYAVRKLAELLKHLI